MPEESTFIPEHEFEAVLELDSENGGVYFLMPFAVEEAYGTRGQLKVRVTIDGFPYQSALFPISDGTHGLVVPRTIRNSIEKTWGHTVRVQLARDNAPRVVEVPADLADALLLAGAREKFANLSYSHQREYVRWVEATKKDDTRRKRVVEAAEMVAAGRKRG
ncbi:MAG: DUF1905 domain-containing protein [Hymenobacteraceae bacterium]|nr:DUF1905 domain-containing protein [Hymenobacteraceae bacterium]